MKRCLASLTLALVPLAALGQSTGGLPALREDLLQEITARKAAVAAEVATLQAADAALLSNITAIQGVVGAQRAALDAEIAARQAAHASLQNSLSAEITARTAAEASQRNDLVAEVAARQAAVSNLQESIAVERDARLLGIAGVQGTATALQAGLSNQMTALNTMEARLASANVRLGGLLASTRLKASIARVQELQVTLAQLVSQVQPGATSIDPGIIQHVLDEEAEVEVAVMGMTIWIASWEDWLAGSYGGVSPVPSNSATLAQKWQALTSDLEEVRNRRQEFQTMFENFDQKTNQLFNILSTVLKTMKEMESSIARNIN